MFWSPPIARVLGDRQGDHHYDTISALIKSLRASDSNAALHYLARMLEAGEDVAFIARRLVIFMSEDVGNAAPMALVVSCRSRRRALYRDARGCAHPKPSGHLLADAPSRAPAPKRSRRRAATSNGGGRRFQTIF